MQIDFNTSYVVIKLKFRAWDKNKKANFNTSYVVIKHAT